MKIVKSRSQAEITVSEAISHFKEEVGILVYVSSSLRNKRVYIAINKSDRLCLINLNQSDCASTYDNIEDMMKRATDGEWLDSIHYFADMKSFAETALENKWSL